MRNITAEVTGGKVHFFFSFFFFHSHTHYLAKIKCFYELVLWILDNGQTYIKRTYYTRYIDNNI
jgi:hypothetical protein